MNFYEMPTTSTFEEMLEKHRIVELISFERFCRDNALWDEMHKCFASESSVRISWFCGTGFDFVEASKKMKNKAPHKLNNTIIWLNGNKAAAITMGCVQSRKVMNGVAYDLTSYTRFLYQLIKENDEWKVHHFTSAYEKDSLVAATPAEVAAVDGARTSYANLAAVLGADGYSIANDLPGDDIPETVNELIAQTKLWLG